MREPGEFVLSEGILGRAVEGIVTRRRRERRAKRCLVVGWDETAAALVRLRVDYPMRLWLVLQLQTKLDQPRDGWIKPRRHLLDQVELPLHVRNVVTSLEHAGLIEVQRRVSNANWRGWRPLAAGGGRLVKRDLQALFRTAKARGWVIERTRSDHFKLKHPPTGAIIYTAGTPSSRTFCWARPRSVGGRSRARPVAIGGWSTQAAGA